MRSRNIKPNFFKNDLLGECLPLARILFEGLWCYADKRGRFEWRPKKIKIEILPYDKCNIVLLLDQLLEREFILKYLVEGVEYGMIPNFEIHQRPHHNETESFLPSPGDESIPEKEKIVSWRALREAVFKRDGRICAFCKSKKSLIIDHVMAVRFGGKNELINLQVLCRACNKRKATWEEDGLTNKEMIIQTKKLKCTNQGTSKAQPKSGRVRPDSLIPDSLIPDSNNPPTPQYPVWLNEKLWIDFKEHRKQLKPKMTKYAERLALKKLKKLIDAGEDQQEIIEQTIERGWKSFFPINTKQGRKQFFNSEKTLQAVAEVVLD